MVKKCRDLGVGPGGFYRPGYQDGAKLRLQMMCLGMNWDPQTRKYEKRHPLDGSETPDIPHEFSVLVERAIQDSQSLIKKNSGENNVEDTLPRMSPNICIVNFYTTSGRLGLHQVCPSQVYPSSSYQQNSIISHLSHCLQLFFSLFMVNLHKYYYLIFAGSLIVYSWYLIIYILVFNCILDAEPSKSLNRDKKKKKYCL